MNRKKIILPCLFIAGLFIYTGYKVSKLSERIQRIEDKLGGTKNILCNQKDTVERVRKSVVRIVGGHGEGSGFAVKRGGFILTNFHVIADELAPKVILPDNTFETAQVIMADKIADLAILKIEKDIPTLNFARLNWVTPAEEVMAIGYPLGGGLDGESFITRGAISRFVFDKENNLKYILTDMTLINGVSGGPMVNICGEAVGIACAGLPPGGMGVAISSDSIFERVVKMFASENPLKDVKKITFNPDKNPLEAVRSFYNYLKLRSMENAFGLLSDNFIKGFSFEDWLKGYESMLDTNIVLIKPDKKIADRIHVKLSTKDLVDEKIVYKYFEGLWDVRKEQGRWLLWRPKIKEVKDPEQTWFLDIEMIGGIEKFLKERKDFVEDIGLAMYELWIEPGNEYLSLEELYRRAKGN